MAARWHLARATSSLRVKCKHLSQDIGLNANTVLEELSSLGAFLRHGTVTEGTHQLIVLTRVTVVYNHLLFRFIRQGRRHLLDIPGEIYPGSIPVC